MRRSSDPELSLLEFLQSTYEAGARPGPVAARGAGPLVKYLSASLLLGTPILALFACGRPSDGSRADGTVLISGGTYRLGSSASERALGYELSPPAVRRAGWYDTWEREPREVTVESFRIDRTPVTQAGYATFVARHRWRAPDISEADYLKQGFLVHPYTRVLPYRWHDGRPDSALLEHPVVLVDQEDARAYCKAQGARLPTEDEWEAACRGPEGRIFPWGHEWRADAAQVEATGTAPVTAHPLGATPDGVLDLGGNVFEWTGSRFGEGKATLKGCGWDDAPGTCRCAFRHGRPPSSRHILIGFRCARDP